MPTTFVIVGGGLAGAKAAEALRAEAFDGTIVLVGEEHERPYARPELSKGVLLGTTPREDVYVHPDTFYEDQGIELLEGRAARRLELDRSQVTLDDGRALHFDRLLLATGAAPRPLAVAGAGLAGVYRLRSLEDCDRLREAFAHSEHLVVAGGGWIGCEVAACARRLGVAVTMVLAGDLPLLRQLGPELGRFYAGLHRDHGVRLIASERVVGVEGRGRVERVRTASGRAIPCDTVVAGVGAVPRTRLAEEAGLAVGDGVHTDGRLATAHPKVFAAGDIAAHDHPRYGRIRIEHWHNALKQGSAAARAMLGHQTPYAAIPYAFSDQYEVGMEHAGRSAGADRIRFRGDVASSAFVAFWMRGDIVVAGINVNVWDVNHDIQDLIASGAPVDERRLLDPDIPMRDVRTDRVRNGRGV